MRKTTRAGMSMLLALGGLLVAALLLAAPASANEHGHDETSVGINASDDSVSSGAGVAMDDSVASGDAVAVDGSVGSGCAGAEDDSTASGGDCKPHKDKHHKPHHEAPVATPVAAQNLAFTGSSSTALAAVAAAMVALGALLVVGTRRAQQATS